MAVSRVLCMAVVALLACAAALPVAHAADELALVDAEEAEADVVFVDVDEAVEDDLETEEEEAEDVEAEAEEAEELEAAPAKKPAAAPSFALPNLPAACPALYVLNTKCKGVLTLQQELVTLGLLGSHQATGQYNAATKGVVNTFQQKNGLRPAKGQEGCAGSDTIHAIAAAVAMKNQPAGTISAKGQAQMKALLAYAKTHNAGPTAYHGHCYAYVWQYLMAVGYGTLTSAHQPPSSLRSTCSTLGSNYARDFADYFNCAGNAAKYGLQKLKIANAYDAPPGSIVVVGPGTPGTANPVAGDITVSSDEQMGTGSHGYPGCKNCHYFINDGRLMNYGDPRQFPAKGHLLGVFAPL